MPCLGLQWGLMQVSALGISYIGDSWQQAQVAGTIMVVVGQWTSNTIHLLSWPNLVC